MKLVAAVILFGLLWCYSWFAQTRSGQLSDALNEWDESATQEREIVRQLRTAHGMQVEEQDSR